MRGRAEDAGVGMRFRKSFKIAPGVRFNISRRSTSLSFGVRGLRHTINSRGRRTTSVGVPGTGISWVESATIAPSYPEVDEPDREPIPVASGPSWWWVIGALVILFGGLMLAAWMTK